MYKLYKSIRLLMLLEKLWSYIFLFYNCDQQWLCKYENQNEFNLYLFASLSLSLSLLFLSLLIFWNVPHAYVDNIQINMDDRQNETLLIISRVRLPWESDKCIILIGLCCILWVLWSLNKNRKTICEPKITFRLEEENIWLDVIE